MRNIRNIFLFLISVFVIRLDALTEGQVENLVRVVKEAPIMAKNVKFKTKVIEKRRRKPKTTKEVERGPFTISSEKDLFNIVFEDEYGYKLTGKIINSDDFDKIEPAYIDAWITSNRKFTSKNRTFFRTVLSKKSFAENLYKGFDDNIIKKVEEKYKDKAKGLVTKTKAIFYLYRINSTTDEEEKNNYKTKLIKVLKLSDYEKVADRLIEAYKTGKCRGLKGFIDDTGQFMTFYHYIENLKEEEESKKRKKEMLERKVEKEKEKEEEERKKIEEEIKKEKERKKKLEEEKAKGEIFEYVKNKEITELKNLINSLEEETKKKIVNATDENGNTPLTLAAWQGHEKIVNLLLDNYANVDKQNDKGNTPLVTAAWQGHLEIVNLLLDNSADVNKQNDKGWTALHHAANKGHLKIVKALVEADADLNATTNKGNTPLKLATYKEKQQVIEYLKKIKEELEELKSEAEGKEKLEESEKEGEEEEAEEGEEEEGLFGTVNKSKREKGI
ncbi:hypothetical protein GF385_02565 [Candidatus Dependentiae bacterium]|nr:hypothetical protein [Candidatus Dependentiae bacterium]